MYMIHRTICFLSIGIFINTSEMWTVDELIDFGYALTDMDIRVDNLEVCHANKIWRDSVFYLFRCHETIDQLDKFYVHILYLMYCIECLEEKHYMERIFTDFYGFQHYDACENCNFLSDCVLFPFYNKLLEILLIIFVDLESSLKMYLCGIA